VGSSCIPRTGMDTEHLSDEFLDMVKACRDHFARLNVALGMGEGGGLRWPRDGAALVRLRACMVRKVKVPPRQALKA
jgi:hypothetical protein